MISIFFLNQKIFFTGKINRVKNATNSNPTTSSSYSKVNKYSAYPSTRYTKPHYHQSYNPYRGAQKRSTYTNPSFSTHYNSKPSYPTPTPTAPSFENEVVVLNGSQYSSKNGKLVRIVTNNQSSTPLSTNIPQQPVSDANSTNESLPPNVTLIQGVKYIKTKTGALVRYDENKAKGINSTKPTPTPSNTSNTTTSQPNQISAFTDFKISPKTLIYCPKFTLTGKCSKGSRCPYSRHDRNHLSLCKQFLMTGYCKKGNRCTLSHIPNEHTLPTCTYYLDGKCSSKYGAEQQTAASSSSSLSNTTSSSNNDKKSSSSSRLYCKFAHPAKLGPGTLANKDSRLCKEFAYTGYCTLGSSLCSKIHSYECPEFCETGVCKQKHCKLIHSNNSRANMNGNLTTSSSSPQPPNVSKIPDQKKKPEKSFIDSSSSSDSSKMINTLEFAKSLYEEDEEDEDSDDDNVENTRTTTTNNNRFTDNNKSQYRKQKTLISGNSKTLSDNDNEEDDEEEDDDEEESDNDEFLNFWSNHAASSKANGENSFNKDDDFIKL